MPFDMVGVESSNIREVGYDKESRVLIVEFHNGGKYAYPQFPEYRFKEPLRAPSHGKYFHANIKNVYPFTKLN